MGAIFVVGILLVLASAGCVSSPQHRYVRSAASRPPSSPAPLTETFGEAARFDLERRSPDPDSPAPIDANRYIEAHRRARALPALTRRRRTIAGRAFNAAPAQATGAWEQLGPNNVAGRARTILVHPKTPNILYTSGAGGGLWKSTDSGASWQALDDFLPVLAIGALAMDPRNPDTLYAGTGDNTIASFGVRGSGIYKSTDAGATWRRLESTNNYDFRFVRSIIFSPVDSNRLYVATNKGILTSNDGGESWTLALDRDIPNRGCQHLAIRTDKTTDYVLASCGVPAARTTGALLNKTEPGEDPNAPAAIFLNKDAASTGSQWNIVLTDPAMGNSSIAIAPSNQNIVYVLASSTQAGPYKDGLLAVYRSETGGEAGSFVARLRNTDTGSQRVSTMILGNPSAQLCSNSPASQAWFVNVIAVDPLNPDRVFAASVDVFRSEDGGATWGQASAWDSEGARFYAHADHHGLVFHPGYNGLDNQTLYAATDGGIFRTDNATLGAVAKTQADICSRTGIGIVWRDMNRNLATTQFYHGIVYPGGYAIAGGLQDNGTQRGSAGGTNFKRILGGDGGFMAIDSLDANRIYASSQSFAFRRSTDGGSTFQSATNGIRDGSDAFAFIAPLAQDPRDSRTLWTGGRSLWRTTDGAGSWVAASAPIADRSFSSVTVSPHDSKVVYAGTRTGEIYRNDDALSSGPGSDWVMSKARQGWVSSILVDAADPAVVYAVYSSFNREPGDAHLYKSFDRGETWQALDGDQIPDAPFFSIAQHPEDPNTLFLAGDLGLFVSNDGGQTWVREDESFPAAPTQYLTVRRDGSGSELYAFTYGRGVWRTRLTGDRAVCAASLNPNGNISLSGAGGVISRRFEVAEGCAWAAFTDATWLRVVSASSGEGATELRLLADANESAANRTATVTIADQSFAVAQSIIPSIGAGDEISSAIAIGDLPYGARFSTNLGNASSNGADPVHSCTGSRDARTVWFRYQAASTQTVTATVTGYRFDVYGNPGTVLAAYPDGPSASAELACTVNSAANPSASAISFPVTAGQSYLIQVSGSGANNAGGFLVFSVMASTRGADVLPKIVDFGAVPVGESRDQRILLKNSGNVPLRVAPAVSGSPQFTLVGGSDPVTLQPGAQREWQVRFTSQDSGDEPVAGVLQFGSETPASIPLRARAK